MIRIIVKTINDKGARNGYDVPCDCQYKTFDIENKDLEAYLVFNSDDHAHVVGCEIVSKEV